MDSSEIKGALKQAKGILAKGDNGQEALILLRNVLKSDPENYQALVLEGAALQQIGKSAQSLQSYKKAISVNPKQVLAWQGVVAHYEKRGIKEHDDLIEAFKNISKYYEKDDDKSKYFETTLKFVGQLQSQSLFPQCLKVLNRLIKSYGTNIKISQMTVGILGQMSNLQQEEENLYLICLRNLHETSSASDDNYRKYFQLLYKESKYDELETACRDLSPRFNAFYHPLDYLCRLYVENQLSEEGIGMIPSYVQKLFKLYPSSSFGMFTQGKIYYELDLYLDAITWLKQGAESKLHEDAVYLLIRAYEKIWDFDSVEDYALKMVKSGMVKNPDRFQLSLANALRYEHRLKEASETLQNLGDSTEKKVISGLVAFEDGKLEEFDEIQKSVQDWRLELCWLTKERQGQDKVEALIQLTVENERNFDLLLSVGMELRKMGKFDEALGIFQQCLGQFKGHPILLYELAQMFEEEEEHETALKYLKSAYKTLPVPPIGMRLSDMYFRLGDVEANKELLRGATKKLKKMRSKWAWLRLGMLHLELKDPAEAVSALQSAIRTDIGDFHVWETLAEAYYARGSYEASLRAFEQCLKLGANPIYPQFKMGVIQRQLGEEEEAIETLSKLVDYSPAIVEMAQTWFQIAKKRFDEGLSIAVVHALNNTFQTAARVMLCPEQLLGLTLMSEAILLAGELNPESKFLVPGSLLSSDGKLEDVLEVGLEQLLRLGLRIAAMIIKNSSSAHLVSYQHCVTCKIYLFLYQALSLETITQAVHHGKKAVSLNQHNYSYWNTLGIVAEASGDKSLALHCYLKSVELNPTGSSTTWTNLGLLLLSSKKCLEAHRCFTQAQRFEPGYGPAWIGQGLVAEELSKEDEWTDLYRHAALLEDTEIQGSLCYAYHIAKIMISSGSQAKLGHHYNYTINHLDALNVSLERIGLFNLRRPTAASLNIQAVLESRVGLNTTALKTFERALSVSKNPEEMKILRRNRMAMMSQLGQHAEVLKEIESMPVDEKDFKRLAFKALALEKTGNLSEAYDSFESLLPLCSDEMQTANVRFSMALILTRLQDLDAAKTLFFQACGSDPTSNSYTALCSLALLAGDLHLAQSVVERMEKKFQKQTFIHTIALFKALCTVAAGGDPAVALRGILSFVRKYPRSGKLWKVLGNHFINFLSDGRLGRRALSAASLLGEVATQPAVALTFLLEGNLEQALKEAKKALFQNPMELGAIAVLVATVAAKEASLGQRSDFALNLACKGVNLEDVVSSGDQSTPLRKWLTDFIAVASA